jgi:hypothetical protein
VLWGFVGEAISADELDGLRRLATALTGGLGATLAGLLTEDELAATGRRLVRLVERGEFPAPATSAYPVIPWPPF